MRILILMAAMLQFYNFAPVQQIDGITFDQNPVNVSFPNTITFSTSISGTEKITDVELLYGSDERTCSDVQALVLPKFTQGKQVQISWEWDMRESGALPPGAEIWWQWRATNEKGKVVTTDKQTTIWLDDIHPWQIKEEDAIRLHYYQISGEQADEFVTTAVNAMDRLEADTGMVATGKIDLFMYPNSIDMRDALLYEPGWTGGMAFPENNKIVLGMEAQDLEWTKRTEAHELTHVLVGNYTFTCLWTTPTWLEEGLAVYGEGSPDQDTRQQFDKAKEENRLLSFRILSASFSEDSEQANLSYSQSYYMVNYLIETYGREKINQLLKTLSDGKTVNESLTDVYGFDLNGFEKEWRKSIDAPEMQVSSNTSKPTEQPTQIPTLQPISGVMKASTTTSSQPTILPVSSTSVGAAEAVAETVIAGTPTPFIQSISQGSNTAVIVLILTGLLLAGAAIIIGIRSRNKKNPVISAFIIMFLTSSIMSCAFVNNSILTSHPSKYPQFPTATLYTVPPAEKDVYYNPAAGISIQIPSDTKIDTSKANSVMHFQIIIGDYDVIGYMISSSWSEDETLQEIAHKIRDDELDGLIEIDSQMDEEITLDDGNTAWLTLSEARNPKENQKLQISLVTVKGYTAANTVVLYSSTSKYKSFQKQIDTVNKSIQVSAPVINGFSRDQLLVLDGSESDNPAENDPATVRSSGNFYLVYSGLVTFSPDLNLTPDLAESWDVSDDGLIYTFHLHPNAVFHNMRPVTAEDVVYSWERAANPDMKSETVMAYLGDIQGVKEMHDGKADHIIGLKIVDEHTLQVSLVKPVPYFLLKLTYPTGYIVDKENVESSETWYLTPNGTGPFRLIRWDAKKEMLYERFDSFYGAKPKIKAISILLYQGTSQQLYEQGIIDYAGIGYSDLIRFTDPTEPLSKQLHSNVDMCTSYISLDVNQPPFDDIKVRQAFAMSLDKEEYVRVITEGGALPASGLYPPALPGYDKDFKGLEYNPEKARALLKASKYGNGELPPIIFSLSGYGSSVYEGISAITQMWEENLGVKITIQNIDPEYYQEVLVSGKHGQLISEGWCADYPDPENFADILFHSGNEMNHGNYSNPELDTLLENARVENDVTQRMEMYSEAEKIIVNDAPAIFWTHSMSFMLVKPYIRGYVAAPMGIPLERYLSIDGEKFTGD